jgi:hypothetical protein
MSELGLSTWLCLWMSDSHVWAECRMADGHVVIMSSLCRHHVVMVTSLARGAHQHGGGAHDLVQGWYILHGRAARGKAAHSSEVLVSTTCFYHCCMYASFTSQASVRICPFPSSYISSFSLSHFPLPPPLIAFHNIALRVGRDGLSSEKQREAEPADWGVDKQSDWDPVIERRSDIPRELEP